MVTSGSMSEEEETERWATRREQQRKNLLASGAAGPHRHRAPPRLYRDEVARCGCRSRWPGPGAGLARGRGESRGGDLRCPTPPGPRFDPRCPVQVTIRATPGLPSLRSPRVFGALRRAIARASVDRFRVIHFSIQQDHGHFIVEGDEARRARGGVHGLAIRLALAVNRALGRRGKVVGDRYHARPLTTPRQMRTSMVYVLLNFRKHLRAPACVDPRSSGPHFSGWHHAPVATDVAPATALPRDLDGAHRLAARGRAVAGGGTPGCAPRPRPT